MKTVREYTFPALLDAVASRYGERCCYSVFHTDISYTYSKLKEGSGSVSAYLMKLGICKGDRIAIIGLEGYDDINDIEWMVGRIVKENVRAPKGTFFYDDLVGMDIIDHEGNVYGKVETVNKMPAGDYLVSGKSYIPFKEGIFIESVDKKEKKDEA